MMCDALQRCLLRMAPTKILIVDDHEAVRKVIRSLLSLHSGWTICGEAGDGLEAIEKSRNLLPDLVLMDISMPRMDGVEAAKRILREIPGTEVIVISQNDPKLVSRQAAAAGARTYITKAELGHKLLPAIEEVISRNPEHAREQSSNLLAAIVDSSDDAIVSKNLEGIITSWNKSAERIFGYTAQEAIGNSIFLIIPEDRRIEEVNILDRLRRGERVDHFQTVRRRNDGTLIDVSLTISPVRDSAGNVSGASKVARDITAHKQAEERERKIFAEIVATNAKFRAVFEQTTQFAGILTKDGKLIDVNRLSLEACGYHAEEVLHKPFWQAAWWRNCPESQAKIREAIPRAAQGAAYREILRYVLADGTERLLDFVLYPILDETGKVLFLHPTGVDITEIKRTEENYRKLAETLEEEVRARTIELENRSIEVLRQSELLRTFSQRLLHAQDQERRHIARELHDSAGQTLTVLGMNVAQLIEKAKRSAPELVSDVKQLEETVQQLHREIRTTSYLLHPPLLDESGLSSALNWYVQGLMERSGLAIVLDVPEEFGRLPRDLEIAIFRLVQECLTNIHRHSNSKTAAIRVAREGDGIMVEIRDQGHGMSPEKLAEVQSGGTGLGIRGMRERLKQFQGILKLQSDQTGTRIRVTIPALPSSLARETNPAVPLQAAV